MDKKLIMNKFKVATNYIKHQLKAYNRHGIHSPFVYNFLEQVLYNDIAETDLIPLTKLRKQLLSNSKIISITDLGAGSTINPNNTRAIKDIAKNSSKPHKYGRLFYRMVKYFETESIVELGSSLGISTSYFAIANPKGKITTIEGCPNTLAIAKENFNQLGLSNIKTIQGDFKTHLSTVLNNASSPSIIFFDGNHQEKATLDYFNTALKYKTEESIFIFDDIHWSEGMTKAWNKIKGHPETVVTLDLFFIGIVFFDSRLTPQNFNIKF